GSYLAHSTAVTCGSGRTRSSRTPPAIIGSPATAWCTASPWSTAARSGTEIAGSGRTPSAKRRESRPTGPRHGANDTVNTNVVGIGGRTWAIVEAGAYPVELDATFESQRHNPFDGTLAGSFTAHPHQD